MAELVVGQLWVGVRLLESLQSLATVGGLTYYAELGAGKGLTGMSKRIAPEANSVALNSAADFEAFAASLKA
jgi:[acyl-carrier-protein] S-malonyltransferase